MHPNILLSAQETDNGIEEQKPKVPRTADHPRGLSPSAMKPSTQAQAAAAAAHPGAMTARMCYDTRFFQAAERMLRIETS